MRWSLLSLLVLASLTACGDEPTKESPLPKPTATANAAKKATPATAAKPATAQKGRGLTARSARTSTVCARYRTRLGTVQRQLAANPGSVVLKQRQASLQSLVADACQ
jgi:hypothetical protein